MKRIGRGFIILLVSIAIAAMTGWGALAILLFQSAQRRCPKNFGLCLRHFWRGGGSLVSFLGKKNSPSLGFLWGFPAAGCLVVDNSP